jgi:hypothetical protein
MPFRATIYKVGINAVVDVPKTVTAKMKAVKGYIPVTGKINGYSFKQTLVSLKEGKYRLYVNMIMLKGGKTKLGDRATFTLKQDKADRTKDYPMIKALENELVKNGVLTVFEELTYSRQKEVLRYLGRLKSKEVLEKNIYKVIKQLKEKKTDVRVP